MPDNDKPQPAADKAAPPVPGTPKGAAAPGAKTPGAKAKFSMPVLQPREKLTLNIFIFMFVLLIVDVVMIHPISNYLQRLDESIKIKEEVIPKRLLILKHKNKIMNEYQTLEPFFVSPSMSQEEETARFLREIEKVSKEAHFFVTNINPVKINKISDKVYELSLEVEGKGGLREIRAFMRVIEKSNPFIRISAYNLKPQSKEADELKVLFSIVELGVKK